MSPWCRPGGFTNSPPPDTASFFAWVIRRTGPGFCQHAIKSDFLGYTCLLGIGRISTVHLYGLYSHWLYTCTATIKDITALMMVLLVQCRVLTQIIKSSSFKLKQLNMRRTEKFDKEKRRGFSSFEQWNVDIYVCTSVRNRHLAGF